MGFSAALFSVFLNLNNKQIRADEQILSLKDHLKEDRERAVIAAAASDKIYEKFSEVLQKNTNAITKMEVVIEKVLVEKDGK